MIITTEKNHTTVEQYDVINTNNVADGFLKMLSDYVRGHFSSRHAEGWVGKLSVQAEQEKYAYNWKGELPSVSIMAEWNKICDLLARSESVRVKLSLTGGIDSDIDGMRQKMELQLVDGSLANHVTFKHRESNDYETSLSMIGMRKEKFVRYNVDFDDNADSVADIGRWFSYNHVLDITLPKTADYGLRCEIGTTIRKLAARFDTNADCCLEEAEAKGDEYSAGITFGLCIQGSEGIIDYQSACNDLLCLTNQAGGEMALDSVFLPNANNALAAMIFEEENEAVVVKFASL